MRPFVQLQRENRFEELSAKLHRTLDRFLAFGEVVGILLCGGLARGYGDHLSEIDLTVFLTPGQYAAYKRGKTPVPLGIAVIDGQLYDIKLVDYEEALAREYSLVELWDLSYARILYDPEEKLSKFLKTKLSRPVDPALAGGLLFEAWWHYRLAGDIWIYRGDAAQGHYVLNSALKPLLGALFLANDEYIPHDKWLVHFTRTLAWKPDRWDEELQAALSTGSFDLDSLRARQQALHRLWTAIDARLREKTGTPLSMMQRPFCEKLRLLVEKGQMPLEEWAGPDGSLVNSEPFHTVTRIRDGLVILDVERLLAVQPQEMYSWFYEVVEAVSEAGR